MSTTLTDRYVHAATRWLPGRTRAEVADELRERIADTMAARGDTEQAERETLEELGDPLRVAVDYTGREPMLIGPRWFLPWFRLLVVLMAIVPATVATIAATAAAIEGDSVGAVIGEAVVTLLQVAVHVGFWTTLVFAILDWSDSPTDFEPWTVEKLPEQPNPRLGELVAGIVMFAILAALVVWQHFGSPFSEDGERIPMADPDLWSWYLPLVLVTLALEAVHLWWVHVTGWTWPAAWANLVVTALFTVPTMVLLLQGTMVNPDLTAHLGWDPDVQDKVLRGVAVAIGLTGLWEVLDGFRRALVSSRAQ